MDEALVFPQEFPPELASAALVFSNEAAWRPAIAARWRADRIVFTLMNGVHPIGSVGDVIKTETYASNTTNIPQTAAPVGINLWCFKATPSKNQSAIIRDFQFAPF